VDWQTWHDGYDRPESWLARRLRVVQQRIRDVLDAGSGELRVISICAGQGRDLLEVLADHPRSHDVRALLVELDPRNAEMARKAATGLAVEVITADAALTDHYAGMAPADLVLACGVFGNITNDDIRRTVDFCTRLCATGGTVIWTRHRRDEPDLVPTICEWFEQVGFERHWVSDPIEPFGVGVHRFTGRPRPLAHGERMFTFVGYDRL
jgi:Methyltransferase domain